ncbi:MAG: glycoside hydrolase family 15 protein [Candidatus Eremiobacteraeota bacterium]|nr:glycoside hydrolase family 15 protein [Candidatus Eremiobacteraeota bacterium]MBC5803066.1 glycoside hydrolase family 15 protein [Candidatus Eremiobacteraeota bacterium]MBC5820512.1 glycoside hydrolase family 15 protein [Candidatus Eremiobacteraeota bacterium]
MAPRIEDYALIGDLQTAALVGRDGSIDWLCVPRFDSPACFAALVGGRDNGCWSIAPARDIRSVSRRYRGDSLVLETTFACDSGSIVLTDAMLLEGGLRIARRVTGLEGTVAMRLEYVVRFDYGSIVPWVRRTENGLLAVAGPDALLLGADTDLRAEGMRTLSDFSVRAGDIVDFELSYFASHEPTPKARTFGDMFAGTERAWQGWSDVCRYDGEHRDAVVRSLITLRALTFRPTGGIVAAPTTSLPEKIGGVRNWDYRYCWLRDATFTLYALLGAGHDHSAVEWRNWLLRAVAGDPAELQIVYSIRGGRRIPETELPWLAGYEASQPVRVGNGAHGQFQLDVYGEVMDLLSAAHRYGIETLEDEWALSRTIVEEVERRWRQPDRGLWEVRGDPQHFTHSKVMAWVALDRGVMAVEQHGFDGPAERWREVRDEIHAQVCTEGFDARRKTFTQYYGSKALDASTLLIPAVGFLPADDERVAGTIRAIEGELLHDGFVMRYSQSDAQGPDPLPPGEGAFLACSFWLVDAYVLAGRDADARALFERLLGLANDVGLLAEEYDPQLRRQVGNFPQAFSHVGLINSAFNLTHRMRPAEERATATGK